MQDPLNFLCNRMLCLIDKLELGAGWAVRELPSHHSSSWACRRNRFAKRSRMAECSSTGLCEGQWGGCCCPEQGIFYTGSLYTLGQHKGLVGEEELVQFKASPQSPWCQWELQKKDRVAWQSFPGALSRGSTAPTTLVCYKIEKNY